MRYLLTRRFALILAICLMVSSCSSGSETSDSDSAATSEDGVAPSDAATDDDATDEDATDEDAADESTSGDSDFAISCEVAGEASYYLRAASQSMNQLNADTEDVIELDHDAILAAIETLRPIQDVESTLGTMRPGLDNMQTDVAIFAEKRYDDTVGEYKLATMGAVVVNVIC